MDIPENKSADKEIGTWLMIGVAMLVIQILLGGITRLTGSGLSITKWEIITGFLPPLNQLQWDREFYNYQHTYQYRLLNSGFSLNDFKGIFFWEWFHRLWGRLIGLAFFIPFIIFLVRQRFKSQMVRPMIILFLLGALQGAVGWIMVLSGLQGDAVYVEPVKLAMHFILASVLIGYTFWFGLKLLVAKEERIYANGLRKTTFTLILITFIQLLFGALMAGNKAAPAAPTWPDINGSFIPAYIFSPADGWKSIMENAIVIHFIHRSLAYVLSIGIIIWSIRACKISGSNGFKIVRVLPMVFVLLQVILGVLTVLSANQIKPAEWNIFQWMAELHQLVAICLLLSLIACFYFLNRQQKRHSEISIDPQLI